MRAPAILRRGLLTSFAVLVAACGQWDDQTAAREHAREAMGCFDVEVERTEAHRFHATGCGGEADIVCSEGSLSPVCIRVAARGTSGGEARPDEEDQDVDVDVDAATDEHVDEAVVTGDPDPAPAGPTAAEVAIRRGLDARAADVIACVDRSSIAVRVNHAADGTVSVTLSGDLRSSPEEGCVRAALGDVRVPPGEPGVVVHLVRVRATTVEPVTPAPETALEAPAPSPVLSGEIVGEVPYE